MNLRGKLIILLVITATIPVFFVGSIGVSQLIPYLSGDVLLQFEETIVIVGVLTIFFMGLIIYNVSSSITGRITKLTELMRRVSRGELQISMDKKMLQSEDEIGALARSLDRILISLKLAVKKVGLSEEELKLGTAIEAKRRAEKEFKHSQAFLQDIFQHAGLPILGYTREGNMLFGNDELLNLTKYKLKDIDTYQKWTTLTSDDEVKKMLEEQIKETYKGNKVKDFVLPIKCADEATVIVGANITPATDVKGNITGFVIFMRDLSEIFQLEEQIRYWVLRAVPYTRDQGEGLIDAHGPKEETKKDKNKEDTRNEIRGERIGKKE